MQKLIEGLHRFQSEVFSTHRDLFANLAKGQSPEVMFICCSDSRINPSLITQTRPGEMFVLRNAGNIVPAYDQGTQGEAASRSLTDRIRSPYARNVSASMEDMCLMSAPAAKNP